MSLTKFVDLKSKITTKSSQFLIFSSITLQATSKLVELKTETENQKAYIKLRANNQAIASKRIGKWKGYHKYQEDQRLHDRRSEDEHLFE